MLVFVLWLVISHLRVGEVWSAYYRIDTAQARPRRPTAECDNWSLEHILVDGIPHQALHPIGQPCLEPIYTQVYRWFPDHKFDNVLSWAPATAATWRWRWPTTPTTLTPSRSTRR